MFAPPRPSPCHHSQPLRTVSTSWQPPLPAHFVLASTEHLSANTAAARNAESTPRSRPFASLGTSRPYRCWPILQGKRRPLSQCHLFYTCPRGMQASCGCQARFYSLFFWSCGQLLASSSKQSVACLSLIIRQWSTSPTDTTHRAPFPLSACHPARSLAPAEIETLFTSIRKVTSCTVRPLHSPTVALVT